MKYPIIITCIFALAGCSTKSSSGNITDSANTPVVIDITKHPEKTINLEDIVDVEYIPLETNDSTLVNRVVPDVVSEQYIVYHNQDGQILVFNRKGKRLYSFNRTGGSPEEYSFILDIVLDEEKKELFIEDISKRKIFVYSINGIFKRSLTFPSKFWPRGLMDYDKDYLFCHNAYSLDKADDPEWKLTEKDIRDKDNPYYFISKQTGEMTSLNYIIPNRIGNQAVEMKNGKSVGIQTISSINLLVQNTPDIMITEFADDTIYSLKDRRLVPVMIKNPSAHKMNPPMMVGIDLFTDRYIVIVAFEKIFEGNISGIRMVYDKQSGEFYRLGSKLPIYGSMKGANIDLPHNTGLTPISAQYLLQDYNDGKLEGELKEIASKLKEDDNPVLMLIKFKE